MDSQRNPHRQGLVAVAIIAAGAALIALVTALPDPSLDRSLLENWNSVALSIAGITAALSVVAVIGWLVAAAVAWDLRAARTAPTAGPGDTPPSDSGSSGR